MHKLRVFALTSNERQPSSNGVMGQVNISSNLGLSVRSLTLDLVLLAFSGSGRRYI